jgi:hypothetical protein
VTWDTSVLLHWYDIDHSNGTVWPVYFGIEQEVPELRGYDGLTFGPPNQVILINVALTKRQQDAALFHEKAHAATWHNFLANKNRNERVVRLLERNFYAMARQCGWRAPPRPDGYERMRRRAMRLHRKETE